MIPVHWSRPPEGYAKINIDDSFEPNTNNGGTGGVIRNHLGEWITGFSSKVKVDSAHHAKLLALLHGLKPSQRKNIRQLLMESQTIKHTSREPNSGADILATHGRISKDHMDENQPNVFDASPPFVTYALARDATGTATYRSFPFCNE
ncbi:hypothetical protein R3W88_026729 [Solanum pinnatisectum]|uniref:RNase H type-1 domain-containing protein n=1 Tax=Solanum pinnatisectum TaxID=50273 RepID=A0AAV9LHI0_9SOLN|nr:hypothetical protein R3W88_026729 [Solanum pinnatisectum]